VPPPPLPAGSNQPGSTGTGALPGGSSGTAGSTGSGGPKKPDNGTNASECVRLKVFFDRRRGNRANMGHGPRRITSHRGTREVVRGVIVNCKGKPVVNAKLDVIHVVKGKRLKKTGVRSRDRGRLTLILPNNLTTRRVVFRYRPFVNGAKVAASKSLRIKMV
jgi:hypothetical protein